jgi:lipoprotein-anchoring transpeptidase ErfK/SrfK
MWTWKLLLGRLGSGKFATGPYAYVDVSETRPETMTLYVDGVVNTVSRANTGIYAAPSTVGSFFVYLKFRSQTMRGTNPDGSKYNDPGVPYVSYYHQSEALHYFTRPGYGWPQSLGCVELPLATAAKIWPLTPIGTVVTVRK